MKEMCQSTSCEIASCRERHPNPCKYYRNYWRCKFSPCAFKHVNTVSTKETNELESEMKVISDKINALDEIIGEKNNQIENISSKILKLESKLAESEKRESTIEKMEEKI